MFNNLTDINIIYDESLCSWKLCVSSGQTNLKQNHRHSCTPENFCIFLRFSALYYMSRDEEVIPSICPYVYYVCEYSMAYDAYAQDDVPCTYDGDG